MEIKYIGPYFSERFRHSSFFKRRRVQINDNEKLLNFFKRIKPNDNTKKDVFNWLSGILRNERANECIDNYKIRQENKFGWNSIVDFLRKNLTREHKMYKYIPNKKRVRRKSYIC